MRVVTVSVELEVEDDTVSDTEVAMDVKDTLEGWMGLPHFVVRANVEES